MVVAGFRSAFWESRFGLALSWNVMGIFWSKILALIAKAGYFRNPYDHIEYFTNGCACVPLTTYTLVTWCSPTSEPSPAAAAVDLLHAREDSTALAGHLN
jgi:hypothetical protein